MQGAGQKKSWGGAGQGRAVSKILRAGQGNSQTQGIFGAGRGSLDNFQGRGSHFSRGRGGACIPDIIGCAPGRSGWPSDPHVASRSHKFN